MAYVPFQDEEESKAATPQTGTGSALPTTGAGGGAAPTTGGPQQAPQAASQGFANINQYLGANQGQGAATANTIASNLQNQYTGLQGDIDTAANQAGEAVKGGSTAYDQNLVSGAVADPSKFVADPNNLAAWQKQYNAAYTGPAAFENTAGYGKAATAANKASQTYQLGQTGGGYTQLLNQIQKNPTVGKTALDKAFIQSDPNAQQTVQSALTPFKGIQDYLAGKSSEIGKQASEAAKTTGETATKTKTAVDSLIPTFETDLTNRLTQTRADKGTAATNAVKNYQSGKATSDDLSLLGFDQSNLSDKANSGAWQSANILKDDYGTSTNWDAYFTQQSPETVYGSLGSVATPEEEARGAALGKLSGQDITGRLGATEPSGSLITTNKEGLGQLGQKVSDLDWKSVQEAFHAIPGVGDLGVTTPSQVSRWLQDDPARAQYIVDRASQANGTTPEGTKKTQAIANAFTRMGYTVKGSTWTPPPSKRKEGVGYAS